MKSNVKDHLDISENRYYTISEVAKLTGISASRIRSWERSFPQLRVSRRNNRYYFKKRAITSILKIQNLADNENKNLEEIAQIIFGKRPSKKIKPPTLALIDLEYSYNQTINKQFIVDTCHVNEKTARKYISTGKAPVVISKLLSLYSRGRVLPEKWTHCFINANDNLEIYGVGEVSECDIETIHWNRQLNANHIDLLKRNLEAANKRIEQLEKHLDAARLKLGEEPAVNN